MNYKQLSQTFLFSRDILEHICDYDNTYKLRMDNVISELNYIINNVEEYWAWDQMISCEETYLKRLRHGLDVKDKEWPYPKNWVFLIDR